MSEFNLCQVSSHHCICFYKGHPRWENIGKFSLEGNSPPSSCLETWLILLLK